MIKETFFQFKKILLATMLSLLVAPISFAGDLVGTVSFVIGEVHVTTSKDEQNIARGDNLSSGQTIITGKNGHIHIRMIDGGFVSVRPSSKFTIEQYHYDALNPQKSRIKFNLEQGTARSITGKAGEASKQSYRLNTPLAAIGIRGTDFVVQADQTVTRVTVQSGAIVMAPLGGDCSANALGSCNTANARVLTEAMRDAFLELQNQKEAPILVPVEKSLSAPNTLSPPRPEEPNAISKNDKVSANIGVPQDLSQIVTAATITSQINNMTVTKPSEKPVVVKPIETIPEVVIPAKIWWGRWGNVALKDSKTMSEVLAPDREVTMGNLVFGMLREAGDIVMPTSGVASFKLAESESYLLAADKTLAVGVITSPNLTIDFGNRKFDTSLTVNVVGFTPTEIKSSGAISFQGIFLSETNSPNTIVAGTLSKNSDQAGYIFERSIGGGASIFGATRWIR